MATQDGELSTKKIPPAAHLMELFKKLCVNQGIRTSEGAYLAIDGFCDRASFTVYGNENTEFSVKVIREK